MVSFRPVIITCLAAALLASTHALVTMVAMTFCPLAPYLLRFVWLAYKFKFKNKFKFNFILHFYYLFNILIEKLF